MKFTKANHTSPGRWEVPCLMNSTNIVACSGNTFEPYVCPVPEFKHNCIYWSPAMNKWTDDGCIATSNPKNLTIATCECTHLTDFASRVLATVSSNKALFDNAKNVYSLSGLLKFIKWYALFGSIGGFTLLLGYAVLRIDRASTRRYVHSLLRNKFLRTFFVRRPTSPVYIYSDHSSLDRFHKMRKEEEPAKSLHLIQRLLQQHPSLQFLFRYDPRLSRLFRCLFVFIVQFHSLFITAVFYNFTYADTEGKAGMSLTDTILLAVITMSLNIPVVQGLIRAMNYIGTLEFGAQFPLLYEEYHRRAEFEKLALIYLFKRYQNPLDPEFVTIKGISELMEFSPKVILNMMAEVISKPWPQMDVHWSCWSIYPCHSWKGAGFLLVAFGYFAFILNYLLLFAAGHVDSVGNSVMTSWGISQLSSIFVIQPITIVMTIGFYWLLNRYGSYLPAIIQKTFLITTVRSIPSLFYFSNPWSFSSHSPLTAHFAYTMFTHCGAYASHAEELAYAPLPAIATALGSEVINLNVDFTLDEKTVQGLYEKMQDVYRDLMR